MNYTAREPPAPTLTLGALRTMDGSRLEAPGDSPTIMHAACHEVHLAKHTSQIKIHRDIAMVGPLYCRDHYLETHRTTQPGKDNIRQPGETQERGFEVRDDLLHVPRDPGIHDPSTSEEIGEDLRLSEGHPM